LARAAFASGQIEESLCLLEPVTRRAQTAGHNGLAVGSLILTALAHQSKPGGIMLPALRALEEALALAEPDGYVRIFLNEGKPMQMLLAQWLAHASTGPLRDYANRLLSQSDVETHDEVKGIVSPISDPSAESRQNLTKLLSQRELEVLHLMALGYANQEIARQLIVAPGTIKAHTASIYRKLEVGNRTEAVARARQLGILP
jgi:LuxR family maltose regulon positive regulatory protein